jgi:hypothetical protein
MTWSTLPAGEPDERRAARLALQAYLEAWARALTVIVGGRPRKLTRTEVRRLVLAAQPRRGVRRPARVDGRPTGAS